MGAAIPYPQSCVVEIINHGTGSILKPNSLEYFIKKGKSLAKNKKCQQG
jgi:hypothetical protein